ncbi:MAG: hypothetical protein AB7O38_06675 [Pirellulaceae bacterium]
MSRPFACVLFAALAALSAGCQPGSNGTTASSPPAPAQPAPVSTPATRIGGLELNPLQASDGSTSSPSNTPAAPPSPPQTEQVKAETGVGAKGKSLEQHSGPIVEPLKAFIRFEQKAVFDIQIPQAMQLFEATEGRKPNSHDEFMSRIIAANNINLPKLPAEHRYLYVPEKGELMVEKPAK